MQLGNILILTARMNIIIFILALITSYIYFLHRGFNILNNSNVEDTEDIIKLKLAIFAMSLHFSLITSVIITLIINLLFILINMNTL